MLATIIYFLLALLILVLIHEYGHFIIARCCNIKVERFSFGVGKILYSWKSRKGTEFAFSLLPLGGYVKMLDETEGYVAPNERHLAFNNKPIWVKIAVVLGGPIANFIFAFFLFWLVAVVGIKALAPIVAKVKPGSIMATAGLGPQEEIIAINNQNVNSWRDFQYAIFPLLGTDSEISLKVKSIKTAVSKNIFFSMSNVHLDTQKPDLLDSLGVTPFIPGLPATIGAILPNSVADKAGLVKGDRFISVNQHQIKDWFDVVNFIKKHPNEKLELVLLRNNKKISKTIFVNGFLGVRSQKPHFPKNWLRVQKENPIAALTVAFNQTKELTKASFFLVGRLLSGKISLQTISGPIGIAQGARESAEGGFAYYLSFLALVSISLGVLNILPIPLLDGGHLLFYIIELIRRKPMGEAMRLVGNYFGLTVIVALTIIALGNDLFRLS